MLCGPAADTVCAVARAVPPDQRGGVRVPDAGLRDRKAWVAAADHNNIVPFQGF